MENCGVGEYCAPERGSGGSPNPGWVPAQITPRGWVGWRRTGWGGFSVLGVGGGIWPPIVRTSRRGYFSGENEGYWEGGVS
eukprot:446424-Hanusia_phi.AAC.1